MSGFRIWIGLGFVLPAQAFLVRLQVTSSWACSHLKAWQEGNWLPGHSVEVRAASWSQRKHRSHRLLSPPRFPVRRVSKSHHDALLRKPYVHHTALGTTPPPLLPLLGGLTPWEPCPNCTWCGCQEIGIRGQPGGCHPQLS